MILQEPLASANQLGRHPKVSEQCTDHILVNNIEGLTEVQEAHFIIGLVVHKLGYHVLQIKQIRQTKSTSHGTKLRALQ